MASMLTPRIAERKVNWLEIADKRSSDLLELWECGVPNTCFLSVGVLDAPANERKARKWIGGTPDGPRKSLL